MRTPRSKRYTSGFLQAPKGARNVETPEWEKGEAEKVIIYPVKSKQVWSSAVAEK